MGLNLYERGRSERSLLLPGARQKNMPGMSHVGWLLTLRRKQEKKAGKTTQLVDIGSYFLNKLAMFLSVHLFSYTNK